MAVALSCVSMTLSNLFTAETWPEIVGYAASVFVVLSFVFKGVKAIRVVNGIGCVSFVIYGAFNAGAILWPIVIPNAVLCGLHLYHLFVGTRRGSAANPAR